MSDLITTEVIRNSLIYIAEEMGIVLKKAAYSPNIKERMDHSCAIFDSQAQLLAQAEHIPVHLGSLPWAMKNLNQWMDQNHQKWQPGHIWILNDPYIAGTHLNDIMVVQPIFLEEQLIGFCANKAHHVDIGGKTPGSISCTCDSLFDEGVVISPELLMKGEELNDGFIEPFLKKIRSPKSSLGDLKAQIAALNLGETRLLELYEKYDIETILDIFKQILNQTQDRFTAVLSKYDAFESQAKDCLEDIIKDQEFSWIQASIQLKDQQIYIDFTGTDPQVNTPFNAVFGVTLSACYYAVKCVFDPKGEMNEGILKCLHITAPEGSLVNPKRPAAVSSGNLETSQRIADTIFKALSKVLPDRVCAASHGSMNNLLVGGVNPQTEENWVFYETNGGGSGASPCSEGASAIQCHMTNTMNTPIEAIEQDFPLLFKQYSIAEKNESEHEFTGGSGLIRSFELLEEQATVTVIGERHKVAPWGLFGGKAGEKGKFTLHKTDGKMQQLPSKSSFIMKKGENLTIQTPGGGSIKKTIDNK